ncbi:hypothetical protein SAMN02745704_02319 [Paucidesulfovibrio gracilis DSM 16080]|uniref:Sulfotransferase family protein n=1 Tax=Paucidesulfovibrio gracilis DSM 16080 TaxID=1121449 RepID=A0A1T4XP39_9BACT|nr:hypothetical protein [Paucidesulfovibrio gracilis]SKA91334.1 hypothetical protein SAMN02745704_02319 [Paucidesulfovibrio gracilis DSM 16080]
MRKTLYLHIGTPKTGSSAIQTFLEQNREVLRSKGIDYPGGPAKKTQFSAQSGNGRDLCLAKPDSKEYKHALRQIQASEFDTVLVSSEFFIAQSDERMARLHKALSDFDIHIIAYLRRQDLYLQSYLQQGVKLHGLRSLDAWESDDPMFNGFMQLLGENAAQALLQFVRGYEKDKVIIRPYEKGQFTDGNIFSDFLTILGIPLTGEFQLPQRAINPGFDRDFLELRMMLNHPKIPRGNVQRLFTSCLWELSHPTDQNQLFTPYSLLSPQRRIALIEGCGKEYEIIAREYLGREHGKLFFDPLPDQEDWQPYPGIPLEKVVQAFGCVCARQQEQLDALQKRENKRPVRRLLRSCKKILHRLGIGPA